MVPPSATVEATRVHVACPNCGTGYALESDVLERPRLKLRCRRCRTVWDPRQPLAPGPAADPEPTSVDEAPAAAALESAHASPVEATAERVEAAAGKGGPAADAAPAPGSGRRRALLVGVYALSAVLALGGLGSLGYAFRDQIPGFGAPMAAPELVDVQPQWRVEGEVRRLIVAARISNPSDEATSVRHVHVKFLSGQGAWIGERLVIMDEVVVEGHGDVAIEVGVEDLPPGTASLELSIVPDDVLS